MSRESVDQLLVQLSAGESVVGSSRQIASDTLYLANREAGVRRTLSLHEEADERASNQQLMRNVLSQLPAHGEVGFGYRGGRFGSHGCVSASWFSVETVDEVALMSANIIYPTGAYHLTDQPHYVVGYRPQVSAGYKQQSGEVLLWNRIGRARDNHDGEGITVFGVNHFAFRGLAQAMARQKDGPLNPSFDMETKQYVGRFGTEVEVRSNAESTFQRRFKGNPENASEVDEYYRDNGCYFGRDSDLSPKGQNLRPFPHGMTNDEMSEFNVAACLRRLIVEFDRVDDVRRALAGLASPLPPPSL